MKIARFSSLFALGLALAPLPLRAETLPIDLEVGYRFLQLTGSEETYRSQLNDRPGFLVHAFNFSTADLNGATTLFDQLRVDAVDLGAGPAGAFRLTAGRHGAYLLNFTFRHSEPFSALTGFANPLQTQGVVVGEHTWDRKRNQFDVDLKLLPGGVISPIVGYSSNLLYGPGATTYHVGQDEFRLQQDTKQSDQEVRVGAAFDAGPVSGQVLQGWRKYHATDTLSLATGAGGGNNPGPVLGQPQSITLFSRTSPTDVNTPTTYAYVRGFLTDRVQLSGFYMHADVSESASDQESLTGSLVSFDLLRFFTGLQQNLSTSVSNAYWRAGGKLEVRILPGLDLTAGYTRRHSELDGEAIINSLFLGTTTFAGLDPKNIQALLDAQTLVKRTDDLYEVRVAAKALGPVSLYAGFSQTKQNLTLTEDPSEIVIPGGQGGDFTRRINRMDGGASFAMGWVKVSGDIRYDDADHAVLRTDFDRRTRVRTRASVKPLAWIELGGSGEWTNQTNDEPGIGYDGRIRTYSADLQVLPVKGVRLHGAYTKLKADSTIPIRVPQDFTLATSSNTEDGNSWEGGLGLTFAPVTFDWSYVGLKNEGSYPYRIDRGRIRLDVDVTKNAGIVTEWDYDRYRDTMSPLSNYRANRFGVYLRWRP